MTQDEMLDVCFFAPLAACLRAKPTRALVQLLSEHFDQNAPTPLALSRAVVALASTEFPGFPDLVECLAALGRETVSERPHNDGAPTVRELTGIPPSRTTYFTDVATFLGRRRGILIARDSAEWKEWEQYFKWRDVRYPLDRLRTDDTYRVPSLHPQAFDAQYRYFMTGGPSSEVLGHQRVERSQR